MDSLRIKRSFSVAFLPLRTGNITFSYTYPRIHYVRVFQLFDYFASLRWRADQKLSTGAKTLQTKEVILMSRDRFRPQLTAKMAISLAQIAHDQNRFEDAQRLLSIGHTLFEAELPPDYVPSDAGV